MNIRQEAIDQLVSSFAEHFPYTPRRLYTARVLDTWLDWFDANAEHIAQVSKEAAYDTARDRWVGDDVEVDEIRAVVAVLREDT